MAAFDCFLDLDPEPQAMATSPQATAAAAASPSAGSDATAVWAFDAKPKQQTAADSEGEHSQHTASPGCSYSGSAGLAAGLLDLQDDACSAPTPLRQRWPAQPTQQQQQQAKQAAALLPDGTPLVAATFFDDLMQRGSVYQYCVHQA